MRTKRKLLIEQLDRKLTPFKQTESAIVPDKGWINAIRTTLNMTMAQLGMRLNITRQGVKGLEESESKGSITINSLKEAGNAMGFNLVYGFTPADGTIDDLINRKAEELAKRIVLRTNHNMMLEEQGIDDARIDESIKELAYDIKREMKKSLWD